MRARLAEFVANWYHAEPFDVCVLVVSLIALAIVLGAGAWAWWKAYVESYDDGPWPTGENGMRRMR